MNCHKPFTRKQLDAMADVVRETVEHNLDDIAVRCCLLLCYAMMKHGLKASTINKIIKVYEDEVVNVYGHYRQDRTGDWYVFNELQKYGVDVKMTKEEL